MTKLLVRICASVCVIFLSVAASKAAASPPNILFILTDNHGAWTLGCYGNKEIQSPNIDRLASEGMLFTRAYCNNSVCSPSRATFLTGLLPSQHGVNAYLPESASVGPHAEYALKEFTTLPQILSGSGYVCGLSGKWHLGDTLHPAPGFTYWFAKKSGHTDRFYNDEVIWNGKVSKEQKYTTDAITEHAIDFLQKSGGKPFFLYLAYNGPYGVGKVVRETHTNRWTSFYSDKPMNSFPREKPNPWLAQNRFAVGNLSSMRNYAAEVSGVDDGVGRVLSALKQLDLETNTLIIFAADQGLNAGHGGYWGMGDHSRPINTHEATVRIPLIFKMPGSVKAASKSDLLINSYDFLPTVLDLVGLRDKTPSTTKLPGKSFAPVLRGEKIDWDNYVFHEFENTRMIRNAKWKLTLRHPFGPDELYDMDTDPNETENLTHVAKQAAIREDLEHRLKGFFATYSDPKWDRWNGGATKGVPLLKPN